MILVSTLEKPTTPQTETGQIPAEQAGIFLEEQPGVSDQLYPADLVAVGNVVPPLTEIDDPIGAVRKMSLQSQDAERKYGEVIVRLSPEGHTSMYVTEEAWDGHLEQEARRIDDKLRIIHDRPAPSQPDD
jgi:hypothetical protein